MTKVIYIMCKCNIKNIRDIRHVNISSSEVLRLKTAFDEWFITCDENQQIIASIMLLITLLGFPTSFFKVGRKQY